MVKANTLAGLSGFQSTSLVYFQDKPFDMLPLNRQVIVDAVMVEIVYKRS